MPALPEQQARQTIDAMLAAAGWAVQDYKAFDPSASIGIALRGEACVLNSIQVAFPPLAEQTRIVAEVERRLSMVEELEAVVTTNLQRATRLRQAVLRKAFAGKLTPTE